MSEIGFRATFVNMEPTTAAQVPNNTFFVDSANGNKATYKDDLGNAFIINIGTATNLFIKQMQASINMTANSPVAKLSNGKITLADSDGINAQNYIGVILEDVLADELVDVVLPGANIVGALTGLGFTPGDEIFISETGGFTNNVSTFTNNDDSIIKVGIADCSAGNATGTVNDLIAFTEVIARP